jgi:hypothetical protein
MEHLGALFDAFGRALKQASESHRPVQVFVSIAPHSDADQDALYVHTPNPNGTLFPHAFEDVRWDVPPPLFLRAFVEGKPWQIGAAPRDRSVWWIIRPRSDDTD